jgi:hypothetical protein
MSTTREDFGPAGLWKAAVAGNWERRDPASSAMLFKLQYDHLDHIHISIQP